MTVNVDPDFLDRVEAAAEANERAGGWVAASPFPAPEPDDEPDEPTA